MLVAQPPPPPSRVILAEEQTSTGLRDAIETELLAASCLPNSFEKYGTPAHAQIVLAGRDSGPSGLQSPSQYEVPDDAFAGHRFCQIS